MSLTDKRFDRIELQKLDGLLVKKEAEGSIVLTWLRQSPAAPNTKHLLEHIDRFTYLRSINISTGVERLVHQNPIAVDSAPLTFFTVPSRGRSPIIVYSSIDFIDT